MKVKYNLPLLVIAGLFFLIPVITPDVRTLSLFILALNYVILVASYDLVSGYTGQLSLGHPLFYGIGAYATGLLCKHLGLSPLLSMFIGAVAAGAFGSLIGVISLRLKKIYLALVTLSLTSLAPLIVFIFYKYTGGEEGLFPLPSPTPSLFHNYLLSLGLTIASISTIYLLIKSRIGLYLRAIRDDELAAESIGINIIKFKTLAFTISSTIAGFAGSFYALHRNTALPEFFSFVINIRILTFQAVGGPGTLFGPVVATIALIFSLESVAIITEYGVIIYSVILMITMLLPWRSLLSKGFRILTQHSMAHRKNSGS